MTRRRHVSQSTSPKVLTNDSPGTADGMSVRASILRLLLMGFLFGLSAIGGKLVNQKVGYSEDHPTSIFFKVLNGVFKRYGWALTSGSWLLLLMARYNRQVRLQENASWRRHIVLDATLWILSFAYWAFCVYFVFHQVAKQVGDCILPSKVIHVEWDTIKCSSMQGVWVPFDISGHAFLCSLGICLLLEEIIRFIGEPIYYFSFHPSCEFESSSLLYYAKFPWILAVGISLFIIFAWLVLFIRTALFYHTIEEKIWGTITGTFFWWFVIIVRFFTLYYI